MSLVDAQTQEFVRREFDARRARVLAEGPVLEVYFPSAARRVDVAHGMGVVPTGYHVTLEVGGSVRAVDVTEWTADLAYMKASASNTRARLFFLSTDAPTRLPGTGEPDSDGTTAASGSFVSQFGLGGSPNAAVVMAGGVLVPVDAEYPEIAWSTFAPGAAPAAKARLYISTTAGTVTPKVIDDLNTVFSGASVTSSSLTLVTFAIAADTADRTYRLEIDATDAAADIVAFGHIQLRRAA